MLEVFTSDQLPEEVRLGIKAGAYKLRCPKCKGGKSGEISLSVFYPAENKPDHVPMVGLKCWRVSCGWVANVMFGEGDYFRLVRQQVHEGRVFDGHLFPPGDRHKLTLRYGLTEKDYGTRFRVSHDPPCLAMEVRGPEGQLRGHLTRTFDKPKRVMAYKESAQPWLDWWLADAPVSSRLFIVEDQISACKIHALGGSAVALLGTHMSVDKAREIADAAKRYNMPVRFMLDPDAFDKSLEMHRKYNHILPIGTSVICARHDPKDYESPDLMDLIHHV